MSRFDFIPENEVWIVVDVESDGPAPGIYSMVSFGAVVVAPGFQQTFYGKTRPLPDAKWQMAALAVSGFTRGEHEGFDDPKHVMMQFDRWLTEIHDRIPAFAGGRRLVFWSDNNGFDWQFINYYLHRFVDNNPFGYSSRRIADYAAGIGLRGWKHLRVTDHTHNPVDDATGNAEALAKIMEMGLPQTPRKPTAAITEITPSHKSVAGQASDLEVAAQLLDSGSLYPLELRAFRVRQAARTLIELAKQAGMK